MVAGVHIRIESKGNARGAGKASSHNERKVITKNMEKYLLNEEDRGENFHHDFGLAIDQVQAEIEANEKVGYKLHHRAKPFKELLFLFEAHHTNKVLVRVVEKLADEYGFRPIQLDAHRDEGSYDDTARTKLKRRNLHAHLLFTTNNPVNNKQISLGGKKEMRKMQKIVSNELGIKLGVGMYMPGGRMDPAKLPSERQPHESHWKYRYRQEEAEKEKRKRLADQQENSIKIKELIAVAEQQYIADREALIASGEAKQKDYMRLKSQKDEEIKQLKAELEKAKESVQTKLRLNYEITIRRFTKDGDDLDSLVDVIQSDEKLTEKERAELLEMPRIIEEKLAAKKLQKLNQQTTESPTKPRGRRR